MYSSVLGGIVTDPVLMTVPIDDHMVHRGDGVFETLRVVGGAFYNLNAHLDRLQGSAQRIGLRCPERSELLHVLRATARAAGLRDAAVRLLLSRGPGSLSVNPYDCPRPQVYIVVTDFGGAFMTHHPEGASVVAGSMAAKPADLAMLKSCNYLANVLLKREAVDRGVDFALAFDPQGFLGEGATENAGVIDEDGCLVVPPRGGILDGTTMVRVMELVEQAAPAGSVSGATRRPIHRREVDSAREILIFGTTTDVTAVTSFEGRPVGAGLPGPAWHTLHPLFLEDLNNNPDRRTPVADA
jgi:branched-chain amino acid aminotransferase